MKTRTETIENHRPRTLECREVFGGRRAGEEAVGQWMDLPLGVVPATEYRQFAVCLEDGDVVMLYTDALIEAEDDANSARKAC